MEITEKMKRVFWKNTFPEPNTGCWLFAGSCSSKLGYGKLAAGGDTYIYAHRASFIMAKGQIPTGLYILHKCDNPYCVNPDHLYAGTHNDNARDRSERHRTNHGEKHFNAKLNPDAVRDIRRISIMKAVKKYGIGYTTAKYVKKRITWRHVTDVPHYCEPCSLTPQSFRYARELELVTV
jgi:hypothetical protein